jgi:hypothetical protein
MSKGWNEGTVCHMRPCVWLLRFELLSKLWIARKNNGAFARAIEQDAHP